MKVALLLFGQPRNIDNYKVIESHKKYIIDMYDTDVFCHTWFKPGISFSLTQPHLSIVNTFNCSDNTIDIINNEYKPKVLEFEEPREYTLKEPYKSSKRIMRYKYINDLYLSNFSSHFYSINRVAKLFEKYSNDNSIIYDFVIVARYDIIILDFPNLNNLDKTYFYTMNHHPRFPDLFFIFHPIFIKSQYIYDNLDIILDKIVKGEIPDEDYWDYSGECLKFNNYLLYFNRSLIRGTYIKETRNI